MDSRHFNLVYKVVGGSVVDAEVFLPPHEKPDAEIKHPVVINIHGGAFMLGASQMVNRDQINDCLERGWIVLVPNHRLCPQVNLLDGPIKDCRDLLQWIYNGEFEAALKEKTTEVYSTDHNHVFAFGTSSGGHLSLCLGFDVPRPVAAVLDFYGPCDFDDSFWTTPLPHVQSKLPPNLSNEFLNKVYEEDPIPTRGGISLEGQALKGPDFSDPRQAFALTQIANGTVLDACFPSKELRHTVDPLSNVRPGFPPTFIVHGDADTMVPISLSRALYDKLQECGVRCKMVEVPNEEHTFAAKMKVGSQTWKLQRKGFDFLEDMTKDRKSESFC